MFRLLFTNTIVNAIGRVLSYIAQLVIIAFLVRQLGKSAFGIVVLAEGLILNRDLFESAFGVSTTKYIAEHSANNEANKIRSVININYVLTFLGASFFCFLLVIFNHLWLISIFNVPIDFAPQAIILVDLFIAGGFFDFFRVSLTRISEGFQDYTTARIISFSKSVFWLIFVAIFVLFIGKELVVVGWAYFIASFLSFLLGCVILRLKYKLMQFKLSSMDIDIFKKMFKFSGWLYLSKFSTILSRRAHIFIIGYYLDVSILAYYQIAYKIYEVLNYGNSLISSALVPFCSKLQTLNDKTVLIKTFNFLTKISVYLIGVGGIFLIFRIDKVITIWVGEGFEPSYLVAQIMIASVILMSLVIVGTEIMIGMNRIRRLVKFSIIASLINLGVVLLLINSLGLVGVAMANLISAVALVLFYLPIIFKELGLKWSDFFPSIYRNTIILFIIYVACLFVIKNLWVSLALLPLMFAAFWFLMEENEKKKITDLIGCLGFRIK